MHQYPVAKPDMNRFSKNKNIILAAGLALAPLLLPAQSFAQAYVSSVPPLTPAVPQATYSPYGTVTTTPYSNNQATAYGMNSAMQRQQPAVPQPSSSTLSAMQQQSGTSSNNAPAGAAGNAGTPGASAQPNLGSPNDPNSQAYKVDQLAIQAQQQRNSDTSLSQQGIADDNGLDQQTPPPDVKNLQQINRYQAALGGSLSDEPVSKELGLDMRKAAQKEAALSYGARGGLAKRNFQIMERMKGFETVLDRVFDFRALLIKAPSGLLIEPPIIKESVNAVVVTQGGDEAAVADKVFDINKKAKIVTAPRDWRQYLIQSWSQVPPPPRVLWPKNLKEQADWDTWVAQGWEAGTIQADQIFEANVNQLVAEYNGMVRYKMLVAQEMISVPYAMHEDRGVQANNSQMRVGDRAVRITGPSQFLTKADLWKPADQ